MDKRKRDNQRNIYKVLKIELFMKKGGKNIAIVILSILVGILLIWNIVSSTSKNNQTGNYLLGNNVTLSTENRFCPWTEFTKEPQNKEFVFLIPKAEWDNSPKVLSSDCWKELRKSISPANNEGICRIRDISATLGNGASVSCECYYSA